MAAKTAAARARAKSDEDVFGALRQILEPYADKAIVLADNPKEFTLAMSGVTFRKKPVWFACVRESKAYTSFHLMPIYMAPPALKKRITPALKKRMQGMSCFNFKSIDPELFAQLADLTQAGFDAFQQMDWQALEQKYAKRK